MNRTALCGAMLCFASAAIGAEVTVGGVNADIGINSKDLSGKVFGGNSPQNFTSDVLAFIHSDINSDGIDTDNRVTICAINTDYGLGLFVLVDREYENQTVMNQDSVLDFTATGNMSNNSWINDQGTDLTEFDNGKVITGLFTWSAGDGDLGVADERGDAFAWSDLTKGDEGTFTFITDPDNDDGYDSSKLLQGREAIQILTYNGRNWDVAGYNDLQADGQTTSMDWVVVIPLPAPAAMAMAGVAGLAVIRRRRF